MNELDALRQEAETLKITIRDARKAVCDTTLIQATANMVGQNLFSFRIVQNIDHFLFDLLGTSWSYSNENKTNTSRSFSKNLCDALGIGFKVNLNN